MEEYGNLHAEARGQSYQLQELKGCVLAGLINALPEMSVSRAETQAKASQEYQDHIKQTAEAITKELKYRVQYEKWKSAFESLRSLNSLEKKIIAESE